MRGFTGVAHPYVLGGHPSDFLEFYSYVNSQTKKYIIITKEYASGVLLCKLTAPGWFQAVENTE